MSVTAMAWAWKQDVSPTDKLVLLALADHSDDDGNCWPGVRGVAEKCKVAKRSVFRALSRLEQQGLLRREPRYRPNGSHTSNEYALSVPLVTHGHPPSDCTSLPLVTHGHPQNHQLEPSKDLPCVSSEAPSHPEMEGVPTRRKQRTKPPADPNVKIIIDHYYTSYLARFKSPPPIAGGKCGSIAKRLLAGRSLDDVKWLISAHLDRAPEMYERKNLYGLEHVLHAAPVLLARRAKEHGEVY